MSLITFTLVEDITDNLSTIFLALISCIVLINVLHITTPKNNKFLYDLTITINVAKITFIKLNKVNSNTIFNVDNDDNLTNQEFKHLLRFCDILSNSQDSKNRNLAFKIICLLKDKYHNDPYFKTFSTAILSKLGNFPALDYLKFQVELPFSREIEKEIKKFNNIIPGTDNKYFTDSQYDLFCKLKESKQLSFSGPTSMGKSFIIKTFIHYILEKRNNVNFCIIVPTRALINQYSLDIKSELNQLLLENNIKVLSTSSTSEITGQESYNYIFILTPERLLNYLSNKDNPKLNFLFIDEAHKLAEENDYRSVTLYLAIEKCLFKFKDIKIYFASPNVSNPEIFLKLFYKNPNDFYKTIETPVIQNLFFINLLDHQVISINDINNYTFSCPIAKSQSSLDVIYYLGSNQSNIIYCNSVGKTIEKAREFRRYFMNLESNFNDYQKLEIKNTIKLIKDFIHDDYYLVDCLDYGIGFHFGNLPQVIRNSIEHLFKKGIIKFLFCTSTLLEGVNLPAKNVFILVNKKHKSNMSRIDFWNLAGRAGRLNYELSGNIFCIRENILDWKKTDIIDNRLDINLDTCIDLQIKKNAKKIERILNDDKDIRFQSETQKEINKYIANIISIDTLELNNEYKSPLIDKLLKGNKEIIIQKAQEVIEKLDVPREIMQNNHSIMIKDQDRVYNYLQKNANKLDNIILTNQVKYKRCLEILETFYEIYNWSENESKLSKVDSLKYYALLMNKWINGFSLKQIINDALEHYQEKEKKVIFYDKGETITELFNIKNKRHVNEIINQSIRDIENILRFTLQKYFNNYHKMLVGLFSELRAGYNWATFLEYGTKDTIAITLQNMGISRHIAHLLIKDYSEYLELHNNKLIRVNKEALLRQLDKGSLIFEEVKLLL